MQPNEIRNLAEKGVFTKQFKVKAIRTYYLDLKLNKGMNSMDAMYNTCNTFGISTTQFYRVIK